jgi:DNA invertase Pin-like site-specific DNA recombinase
MATKTTSERMKDYRARMRAKGFKQVQMWVYDTDAPDFKEELKRQVSSLNKEHESEVVQWTEEVAYWPGDDE